jgi:hypothetical protein
VGEVISKIKVNGRVFENVWLIGFGEFGEGDGFLIVIESDGKKYAISPKTGKVFNVVERGTQFFVEIPYGGRVYRAPLRFKL